MPLPLLPAVATDEAGLAVEAIPPVPTPLRRDSRSVKASCALPDAASRSPAWAAGPSCEMCRGIGPVLDDKGRDGRSPKSKQRPALGAICAESEADAEKTAEGGTDADGAAEGWREDEAESVPGEAGE